MSKEKVDGAVRKRRDHARTDPGRRPLTVAQALARVALWAKCVLLAREQFERRVASDSKTYGTGLTKSQKRRALRKKAKENGHVD